MIAPIVDHIDQALSKLIDRYKRKPRFAAWVAAHVRRWQELEDAGNAMLAAWDVDTCDLVRLRILAKSVGQEETGTLEQFRMLVKVRIAVNRSRGKISDIRQIATALLGAHTYHEPGRAFFLIRTPNQPDDPKLAARLLREAKSAGVGMQLVYPTHADRLRYSSAANPVLGDGTPNRGFSSAAGFTGAKYSAVS